MRQPPPMRTVRLADAKDTQVRDCTISAFANLPDLHVVARREATNLNRPLRQQCQQ